MNTEQSTQLLLRFVAIFFLVFFVSAVVLFIVDFVPEKPSETKRDTPPSATASENPEEPLRIVIDAINIDTDVMNPVSTSVAALDEALLNGAVRYPGSSKLGEDGTVYLFGHQSYLPVVRNKNFKAFNGLQKLHEGDTITVYSGTTAYTYTVRAVSLVDASDALIPLASDGKTLFLSTCNSFGDPGERYVVKADYASRTSVN